jgi:pimeloyl-ACP methyl ester carboxylesterase
LTANVERMLLRGTVIAAVTTIAVLSGQSAGAPPALLPGTDYAATASAMTAAGYGSMAQGRQFLAFDPSGDGRAVEVLGDLAIAERVVILVPGSDTTLRDFDRGLSGVSRRAPAAQARAVRDAVQRRQPGAPVAVIAWLGYDPPEGIWPEALGEGRAGDGAAALRAFVATLPGHGTVVLVGHSYGSVVVALAASHLGPRVTDIVALASPGMRASRVKGLGTAARVWVATAPGDWIRHVPGVRVAGLGHGPVPADARELPVTGVDGHDGYLVSGSATLEALAKLALQN